MTRADVARKLREDILSAVHHARVGAECIEDGGTGNLDSVRISVGPGQPIEYEALVFSEALGVEPHRIAEFDTGFLSVRASMGQAAQRTAFAEACAFELRDRGWPAYVHYITD